MCLECLTFSVCDDICGMQGWVTCFHINTSAFNTVFELVGLRVRIIVALFKSFFVISKVSHGVVMHSKGIL